jgi:thioredoxin reductase
MWDAIVIGGGPAGLAAATWLARYRRKVLVLDSGEYRNAAVTKAHGYLGTDAFDPRALRDQAHGDLARYATVEVRRSRAVRVTRAGDDQFEIEIERGRSECTRRVVLATGVRDRLPDIDGFLDHYGESAFHCATCDGYEARDRDVVVVGWSEHVAGFALGLLDWARSVTVVTDGRSFEGSAAHRDRLAAAEIEVREDVATRMTGTRGALDSVRLASGATLPGQMLFFSIAHDPASTFAEQLGCRISDQGCVIVDDRCETTVPGLFAAGDMTPGIQLVQIASAKGAIAGVACAESLRGEPAIPGIPEPAPAPAAVA